MVQFLVPLNFTKESYLAVEWAAKLSGQIKGSCIYLACILPPHADEDLRARAKRAMDSLVKVLPTEVAFRTAFPQGPVAETIAEFCSAEKIDMVVMTTRGRYGAARQLEDSVSEETVRLAACPVLVLHLNQTTAAAVTKRFEGILPEPEKDGLPF